MQPTVDDVRYDLAMTRARMAATLEEIEERLDEGKGAVRQRVDQARQALDVRDFAREHPWMAVGAAMAIGMLVAGSGADRRAASAVTDTARALPGAAMGAGSAIADKVKGLRGTDAGDAGDAPAADAGAEQEPGFFDRVASRLGEALQLDRLVAELAEASRSFAPAPERVPGAAPGPSDFGPPAA
jgi:ElaB/YqjD/DUF883 family membrane-anchored ribosome-binding protein